ncbi:hypothetical protein [Streptomyces gardneri]|uniref:hypothetical protein n=1 Tax=Streptomyces gardneri TaxID=66892 RepID=UPI0037CE8E88
MRLRDPHVYDGNFHEVPQIDSGALSHDTTHVMLTLGGNYLKFDEKIRACVMGMGGCPEEGAMRKEIDAFAEKSLKPTLEKIHKEAPYAGITLLGYPRLFSDAATCAAVVSAEGRALLNRSADYLEVKQREAAESMSASNVRFKSPQTAFDGKRVCDATEGINGLVSGPVGGGDFHQGVHDVRSALGLAAPRRTWKEQREGDGTAPRIHRRSPARRGKAGDGPRGEVAGPW